MPFRLRVNLNMTLNNSRPVLTKQLSSKIFKLHYWYKKELIAFCIKHKISATGGKLELSSRIEYFLSTGKIDKIIHKKSGQQFDSNNVITPQSKVINFKCDAKTREFFIARIGNHFKFNEYLRQFIKTRDLNSTITYEDLIKGWIMFEENKKISTDKPTIAKQFQFNQFQRDFYKTNKKSTRAEMLTAWKIVKSCAGPATYDHYLKLTNKM